MAIVASFDKLGDYAWHCHILSQEDNEMMRPYSVVSDWDLFA
ncbi:MAG: multicopper oxidase domain-containing protein [Xanthobacteraceae bacterium]